MAKIEKFIPCSQIGGPAVCPYVVGELVNNGVVEGGMVCPFHFVFNIQDYLVNRKPPKEFPDDLRGEHVCTASIENLANIFSIEDPQTIQHGKVVVK